MAQSNITIIYLHWILGWYILTKYYVEIILEMSYISNADVIISSFSPIVAYL